MPAGAKGPPLQTRDFDEAFYVLEGELTIRLGDELIVAGGPPADMGDPADPEVTVVGPRIDETTLV